MSKTKILMINLLTCLATGACIGLVWLLCDGAKPVPKVVQSKEVKIYQAYWMRDGALERIK